MSSRSGVHIVVFEPAAGGCGASRLLAGLGPEVGIEIVRDVEAAAASAAAPDVDLLVADVAVGAGATRLLDALRRDGPPVVITGAELATEQALDWFRRGAADCVSLAGRGTEALAVVVLEQVRRWRAVRERGATEQRIRELERFNEDVIRNMNSAVLVMDTEGRITSCNPPAAQILGHSEAALVGRPADDWFRDESGQGIVARTLATGERFRAATSGLDPKALASELVRDQSRYVRLVLNDEHSRWGCRARPGIHGLSSCGVHLPTLLFVRDPWGTGTNPLSACSTDGL